MSSETSPIHEYSFPTTSKPKRLLCSPPISGPKAHNAFSIDASVKLMDYFNDAGFYNWVKDQRNAKISAYHLGRIMRDYEPDRVADGLRWLFEDWHLINIALVLRIVLIDHQEAGWREERILQRITLGWHKKHVEHLLFLLRHPVKRIIW